MRAQGYVPELAGRTFAETSKRDVAQHATDGLLFQASLKQSESQSNKLAATS